jgi:hypothetical protein
MITCDEKHRRSPFDIVGHYVSHLASLPATVPRGAAIFCRGQALLSVGRCSYAGGRQHVLQNIRRLADSGHSRAPGILLGLGDGGFGSLPG